MLLVVVHPGEEFGTDERQLAPAELDVMTEPPLTKPAPVADVVVQSANSLAARPLAPTAISGL